MNFSGRFADSCFSCSKSVHWWSKEGENNPCRGVIVRVVVAGTRGGERMVRVLHNNWQAHLGER